MSKDRVLNANDFPEVYAELGVDLGKLGCLMLDVKAPAIVLPPEFKDALYYTTSPDHFWIDGYVFEKTPHMTLFYGFMKPAEELKPQIEEIMKDIPFPKVKVSHVGFFNSPYEEDPYYCLVAHLEVNEEMQAARMRLELLPHINTYPSFLPHVTIAYIKKDDVLRNAMIRTFHSRLKGRVLAVEGFNYGGNH